MNSHDAVTAICQLLPASALKIRSVEQEVRWRWRLKVLWDGMHAEEPPGRIDPIEPPHLALSSSHHLMRIFCPIVLSEPLFMRAGQS